jgi:hypothetical protein
MRFHSSGHTSSVSVEIRPNGRNTLSVFQSGGDSATGSGGDKAENNRCDASCVRNGKWITSLTAIVAPHTCTLVRDAASVSALARPV